MFSALSDTNSIISGAFELSSTDAFNLEPFNLYIFIFLFVGVIHLHQFPRVLLTLSKRHILDSSEFKEIADDNFKFDENVGKFYKRVENTM